MRSTASLIALGLLAVLPAQAQDAGRGRLLYETHCVGCHYARLHDRDRAKSRIQSAADLRDEVSRRAGDTRRPFTLDDLEDLFEYLNRSHYRMVR